MHQQELRTKIKLVEVGMSTVAQTQVSMQDKKRQEVARQASIRVRQAYERQQQCMREIQKIQQITATKQRENEKLSQNIHSKIQQTQQQSSHLKSTLIQLNQESERLKEIGQQCHSQLEQSMAEMNQIKQNLNQLKCSATYEQKLLKEAIGEANDVSYQSKNLSMSISKDAQHLSQQYDDGNQIAEQLTDLLQQIQKSGAELMLLAYDPELTVPSMLTLNAMDEQGYQLCYTINQDEITTYFEHSEEKHQLAVRHTKVTATMQTQQWALAAETFGVYDDHCSDIIEDFEYSLEDMGAEIVPGTRTVNFYRPQPKPDGILIAPINQNAFISNHGTRFDGQHQQQLKV